MTRSLRFCVMLCLLLAWTCLQEAEGARPTPLDRASVGGKYARLLAVLEVPADLATYGKLHEFGYWSGTQWAGHENLPSGYWVYVAPSWYIWGQASQVNDPDQPRPVEPAESPEVRELEDSPYKNPRIADPYEVFLGGEIVVVFTNGTAKAGRLVESGPRHLMLQQTSPRAKLLVPKKHLAYVQGDESRDAP